MDRYEIANNRYIIEGKAFYTSEAAESYITEKGFTYFEARQYILLLHMGAYK